MQTPVTVVHVTGIKEVKKDTFSIDPGEVITLVAKGEHQNVFFVEGGATRIMLKELSRLEKSGKINLIKY